MTWPALLLVATGLSTVAVDLPAETPPEMTARVVDSCNAVLGAQRCEAAQPDGRNDTTLRAVVRFDGSELEIRLFRTGSVHDEVDRRSLVFSEGDAATDRFIAAGLMVAALAAAQPGTPPPEPEPDPQPPDEAAAPGPPPIRPPPTHLGLDAALQLGLGLDRRHLRWGGMLGVWWMAHSPRLGVRAAVSYLTASSPLRITWASVSLGAVSRLTRWSSDVRVTLAAEAMVQRADVVAERAGARQSSGVLRWGGRLGARVGLDLGGPVRPWLEGELTLLRPGFEVRLEDERVGTEHPLGFGLALGVTVLPFQATRDR